MPSENHPEKIGKYEIEGVLGSGAMGVVYKGFDPKIERLVAIKTVRRDLLVGADGEDWLARFSREARAAGRCLHPNIVALFDYDQHDGMPFIAMEYVEGRELADLFKEGKDFGQGEALDIIRQVLSALDYAHASGIVHRDIKPANIILVDDGSVQSYRFRDRPVGYGQSHPARLDDRHAQLYVARAVYRSVGRSSLRPLLLPGCCCSSS